MQKRRWVNQQVSLRALVHVVALAGVVRRANSRANRPQQVLLQHMDQIIALPKLRVLGMLY